MTGMKIREIFLAFALVIGVAGLAMAFVPGFAAVIPSPSELPLFLGAIAVIAGVLRARAWVRNDDVDYQPVERERPTGVSAPGVEFDRMIARAPKRPSRGGNTRLIMVRQSLREAAIETLVTYQGHTEASARRAIVEGTWTDDKYAREFFTNPDGGGTISESVTSSISGGSPFNRRADRAAREIERLAGRDR